MNNKLKKQLKNSFHAPKPTNKNKFLMNFSYQKTTKFEFFISQIAYIRRRFWCLSVLVLIILVLCLRLNFIQENTICIVSAILPLLTLLSITEISKSTSNNMAEMEMSCKYNLSKIILMRMSLIGSFHLSSLLFMVFFSANFVEYDFLRYLLYSITPFLICSYLSLVITNHIKTKDTTSICGMVTVFVCIATFMLTSNFKNIYTQESIVFWIFGFILILAFLFIEIINFMKRTEELQCYLQ